MYLLQVLWLGSRLVIVPWLVLGPLAASMALTVVDTSVTAAAAVLAVVLLSHRTGDLQTGQGVLRVLGGAASGAIAVINAAVRIRREGKLRSMTEVASIAQATILRPVPSLPAGLAVASRYQSASADSLVGGDLFDVLNLGDRARVLIGDVRGKGLPAVQLAAAVLSAFRVQGASPERPLEHLAAQLETAARPGMAGEDFVTVLLCDVWPDGRIDVVSCGHPSALVVGPEGQTVELLAATSPPLGLGVTPTLTSSALPPGWRLLLYTDGLTEARDGRGGFFEPRQIGAALAAPSTAGVREDLGADLDRLLDAVRHHVGGTPGDDLALLLLSATRAG
jgi:phosphoserine phosphatase RsbU/P